MMDFSGVLGDEADHVAGPKAQRRAAPSGLVWLCGPFHPVTGLFRAR